MVERSTCYLADRNRVREIRKQNATESGSRGGDTCAIDEMETTTKESRRREPTEAYKEKKTNGVRRRKDLVMKRYY
jgi:hypothetical protein